MNVKKRKNCYRCPMCFNLNLFCHCSTYRSIDKMAGPLWKFIMIGDKKVYIWWEPWKKTEGHTIERISDDEYEVMCSHDKFDFQKIREEVEKMIYTKLEK